MLKTKIIRRLALLISLIMLLTSTINTTYGFIVTKTDSIINTFTPFESIISKLLINKSVDHPLGDTYVIPTNIAFDFKVDFGKLYANTTIKTTDGNVVADKNGSIQITVKPNKAFAVEGIDAGTKVTVTEIQKLDSGFTVKDNAATMEGVVAEDGSLKFDYVNIYTPTSVQPVNVSVIGTKILEGRKWQKGDTFSFNLEQKNSKDKWVSLGKKTITYEAKNTNFNKFDFSDLVQELTFDKVGTYSFRLTEVAGKLENVDYDKNINAFDIKVTDIDMDGKLEIGSVTASQNAKVTEKDGKFVVDVTFNNKFTPVISTTEEILVDIFVNKTVDNKGNTSISPAGFEFVLENTLSGEKQVAKSGKKGLAVFSIPFTSADIDKMYTYTLSEIDGGAKGVTYDKRVYDITIHVSLDKKNKLIATTAIDGEIVDTVVADFENIYDFYSQNLDAPETQDNSHTTFWLIMMIISGTAFAVLLVIDKKRTRAKH